MNVRWAAVVLFVRDVRMAAYDGGFIRWDTIGTVRWRIFVWLFMMVDSYGGVRLVL